MSLATSDLLVGLSSVLYSSLVPYIDIILNRQIFAFMVSFSFVASLLNLLLIGLDRLIAVGFPFKHRIWMEKRYTFKAVVFIWLFLAVELIIFAAIGITDPANMEGTRQFYHSALPVFIIISFLALSVLYGLICYFYMLSQRKLLCQNSVGRKVPRRKVEAKEDTDNEIKESAINTSYDGTVSDLTSPSATLERKCSSSIEIEVSSQNENTKSSIPIAKTSFVVNDFRSKTSENTPKTKTKKSKPKNSKPCCFCRKEMALLMTCTLVILSFFICTLPFAIHMLFWGGSSLEILLIANSLTNPAIYFYKGADRKRIANLLRRVSQPESHASSQCHCKK